LIPPDVKSLVIAAELIESLKQDGPVLVSCALGYSRSVLVIITWLIHTQRVAGTHEAIAYMKSLRPAMVVKETEHQLIDAAIRYGKAPGTQHGG
jgi:protein-tyrosine phosphatase